MPLSPYRVLQIGSGVALDYCGKIFADFGADVIKLEPADGAGDTLRTAPPLLPNGASGLFAWLNTNKRSAGEDALAALAGGADVLLDGRPPHEIADGHAALRRAHPGLAITTLSWFGEDGPYRDFAATEATVRALAGLVTLTGPAEGPPILATDDQSAILCGLAAFIATAGGLWGREGGARRFSVSLHETAVNVAEYEAAVVWDGMEDRRRTGVNRFGRNYPVGIFPTSRGLVGVTIVTPGQWRGLCAMLGRPELAREPRFSLNVDRLRQSEELDAIFGPIWLTRSAEEWFALALEHKLPIVVVPTMAELLSQSVHRERGAFVPIRIGDGRFEAPMLPLRLAGTPPRTGGEAPLQPDAQPAWRETARPGPTAPAPEGTLPLEGLRIIDLTMGWAGPTGARHLGDLGAEVIKVEACQYPDWWRGTDLRAAFIAEQRYEKIPWFQLMNRNKLDVTLDLTQPDGVALLKRLVSGAHAVIENYSSEVLGKLGLDYGVLSQVRPGLVMLSMPAFGSNNPWSACRAYGSTLEQASGLPTITGFPQHPPTMNQTAYGDPVGGFNASAALIVALLHQQRTGEGQNIDLSQVECMLPLLAGAIIEQSATGAVSPRIGNRHAVHVPQGCFRCAGNDAWIAVSVTSDDAWRALCGLLGRQDLAALSAPERRTGQDRLEALIEAWTAERDPDEAMALLQQAGVAAGVARLPGDLDRDPHLIARSFWRRMDRPFIGPHWQSAAAFREGPLPYPIRRVAPTLGQDNREILCGRLGLDSAAFADLEQRDIVGTVPKPRRPQGDAA